MFGSDYASSHDLRMLKNDVERIQRDLREHQRAQVSEDRETRRQIYGRIDAVHDGLHIADDMLEVRVAALEEKLDALIAALHEQGAMTTKTKASRSTGEGTNPPSVQKGK